MYEYRKLNEHSSVTNTYRPSDDMLIKGQYLSDLVPGYQQLHVSGRGLLSRSVKRDTIPRRAGSWYSYSQDEEGIITVTFKLEAPTSEELRERYWQLNKILRPDGDFLKLKFRDELDYTYEAIFMEGESNPEQALSVIDKLVFVCPDPYKYKEVESSSGTIDSSDWVELTEITGTVKASARTIDITNGRETIHLKGNYVSGDKIVIRFGDEISITKNGNNILHELQLHSPLEFFDVKNGERITSNELDIQFKWREYRA
ncbi:distal tail protein Dit [Facklamia hominis]|uniref:Phage tail family protein n=1 Tax=Facklamia hominis TaxID=178214 RepID=A0AAJ1V386_9LACT|nr:distal tail protein Dit [Facklamia hominis]MDK7187923.1 phage tail family protein [Facklamia hominis]